MIVKAAEETPAAVAAMVDCLQAELPPGVLQLVYGNPVEISETLSKSIDLKPSIPYVAPKASKE